MRDIKDHRMGDGLALPRRLRRSGQHAGSPASEQGNEK
jgi:hypothetical protein